MSNAKKDCLQIAHLVTSILLLCILVGVLFATIKRNTLYEQDIISAYTETTSISVNVLKNNIEQKQRELENIFVQWNNGTQMRNALKNGYIGTFAEMFDYDVHDENIFCMFTDAEGNIVWKSANYNLATYAVELSLSCEPEKIDEFNAALHTEYNQKGLYVDENVPVSVVFTAPVVFGGTNLLGVCYLGYDLSTETVLSEVKALTDCEFAVFTDTLIVNDTFDSSNNEVDTVFEKTVIDNIFSDVTEFTGKTIVNDVEYYSTYETLTDITGTSVGYFVGIPTNKNT